MNHEQAIAAIGQRVSVRDGTPKPPARFNRKVDDWKNSNFDGILREVEESRFYDGYSGMIELQNSGWIVINVHTRIDNILPLENEEPAVSETSHGQQALSL